MGEKREAYSDMVFWLLIILFFVFVAYDFDLVSGGILTSKIETVSLFIKEELL